MNLLLLGSGGREHALAWKIAQSPKIQQLYIAPGNAGTAAIGHNVDLKPDDFTAIRNFVLSQQIDMVVVGPEAPLVLGIYDFFHDDPDLCHIPLIGPSRAAAQLEGSKDFAKRFMERHGVPTASHRTFTADTLDEGVRHLATLQPPYVLKADGLCAGKGVLILNTLDEAQDQLRQMLGGRFGQASTRVVIEEFLSGIECSVFVITDGHDYKILPEAKDYKRIGDGDTGPNTGGMGSVSPVPFADKAWMQKVEEQIIQPTIRGLAEEGLTYQGFIFFGLINCQGQPKVIEYNCRMGDPETESVMMRIQSDLVDLLEGVAGGDLASRTLCIDPRSALCLMLVSQGYPGAYTKGYPIEMPGTHDADTFFFHAGTTHDAQGRVLTDGGRVIAVAAVGEKLAEARRRAYKAAEDVRFQGKTFRHDIGGDL